MPNWVVYKFGGTSVANAERYKAVTPILELDPTTRKGVVVSAMSGVTDALLELVDLARRRDDSYLSKLGALGKRHLDAATALSRDPALAHAIEADFRDIAEVLRATWLARHCSERITELVAGYGEVWSAQLLNAWLRSQSVASEWLDARQVLVVEAAERSVAIDWDLSRSKLESWLAQHSQAKIVVITGFVASTHDGLATTLKRNGSDYSASIFGALLKAQSITIWKEVDGVLSADPRLVPDAVVLPELSYNEATEMAYFGAKVIHPSTMVPAVRAGIPVYIRNTFNPSAPGTKIHADARPNGKVVKGFATVDNMALVNVEGSGMMGVPGIAEKLFGSLRQVGVSVSMISQASSEHSICFAVPQSQAQLTQRTVESTFAAELQQGVLQTVEVIEGCSLLAVVGDGMAEKPGIAGAFLTSLAKANVNVRAIAQGSSERNISVAINGSDARRALRSAHSAFYLSNQTLSIGLIGPGLIGGTFLKQLNNQLESLRRERHIDFRVRGIMNSKSMWLADQHIDLGSWKEKFPQESRPADLESFVNHINAPHLPHAVIIDGTSSPLIGKSYPDWLRRGLNIITPNKKANTESMDFYRELKSTARRTNKYYLYETTVGAGLPIVQTLHDIVETGDEVQRIEGVFSGTLAFLFNAFTGERPFSEIVFEAKNLGYTEPDPRDDLSGMDVARKVVILAREMGLSIEVSDVEVQSLVPEALRGALLEEYMKRLPEFDAPMMKLLTDARERNEVLRYVGVVDPKGRNRVELKSYPRTHSFARTTGSDNIIAFTTARYSSQPLVVQGPGAGPEVTAAGVFGDLLRLASYIGAPM